MTRINADGSDVINFMMEGGNMNNFKAINNSLYMVGDNRVLNSDNYNVQIIKTDLAGNLDTNFGVNGSKIIDFGGNESLYDIVLTSDGTLLCSGDRRVTGENTQITFKIDATTGALIQNANNTDYREYHCIIPDVYPMLDQGYLQSYGDGYLLIGWMRAKLSLISIDENGLINTAFGDNGYRIVSGLGDTLDNLSVVGDRLYCTSVTGEWVQYNKLFCYDIAADQVVFNSDNGPDGVNSFLACPEGIYTTAKSNFIDSNGPTTDKFILRRKSSNGEMDGSFNLTGSFTYDSPTTDNDYYQDEAQTILKLDDGSFLLGGYTRYHLSNGGNFFGRTIIKVKPQILTVDSQIKGVVALSPNPFQDKINLSSQMTIKGIKIYDLSGRIILKPEFESAEQITIDVSEITQKGVYLMELATENASFTRKIIKG